MVDAILAFISEHRAFAGPIAFALALAETLPLVSAVVPTTPILIAAGGLVAAGALDLWPLVIGAGLGAAFGSTVAWALGRAYGPQLLRLRAVRRRIGRTGPARRAFRRWGAPAVVVGHLGGPFRAVAFALAGLTAMPFARFLPMTLLGAAIWAAATPMIGKLGGDVAFGFF